jgi:hypothetical protein
LSKIYSPTPAWANVSEDHITWRLVQAFGGAIRDISARNQQYWWVYALLLLLLIGFVVYLYFEQKKLDRKVSEFAFSHYEVYDESKRNFARVAIDQDLYYARVNEDSYQRAKIINISGGGVLFATNQRFKPNDELNIVLELNPGEVLRLRVKIVRRAEKSGAKGREAYMVGGQFVGINKNEQDKIIRKIIQEQQGSVIEEKRKQKNECILCGEPIPPGMPETVVICPKCGNYVVDSPDDTPERDR